MSCKLFKSNIVYPIAIRLLGLKVLFANMKTRTEPQVCRGGKVGICSLPTHVDVRIAEGIEIHPPARPSTPTPRTASEMYQSWE
jgi:hypothetical protein